MVARQFRVLEAWSSNLHTSTKKEQTALVVVCSFFRWCVRFDSGSVQCSVILIIVANTDRIFQRSTSFEQLVSHRFRYTIKSHSPEQSFCYRKRTEKISVLWFLLVCLAKIQFMKLVPIFCIRSYCTVAIIAITRTGILTRHGR